MIRLLRVDHRLLHGQVAFSWTADLGADCILIANDEVMTNEVKKMAIGLAKPSQTKLVMKSVQGSIEAINSGKTDTYKLFVVVASVEDAYKLIKNCNQFKQLNLGGAIRKEDSIKLGRIFFAAPNEIELLNELADEGIEIDIRQIPSDSKDLYKKQ